MNADEALRDTLAGQGVSLETATEQTLTDRFARGPLATDRTLESRPPGPLGPAPLRVDALPEVSTAFGEEPEEAEIVLRDILGEGGMGRVALARQRSLRREVAVKVLKDGVTARACATDALIQEGLFTGYLEHPNIVPVHVLGRDGAGQPLLVMKRVEGAEWRRMLADPAHPRWQQVGGDRLRFNIEVLIQVCNAVQFAHSRRILHRDIKPENVMIGDFGEVYLLDWGVALRLDEPRSASPAICGTPAYMAPEMLDGAGHVDERTDVYLLGATLHHVLTGAPRHAAPDLLAALARAYDSEPYDYGADVPAELADLCRRATHRDPQRRPPSALAFRQELLDFLQHRGSVALSDRTRERLAELERRLAGPDPDRHALTAVFSECRFGFRQALHDWPGNAAARAGLQRALELRIERALRDRDADLAESLLPELPEPRADLAERLAALRREVEGEGQARTRLRRLVFDLDVGISGRERARLALLVGFLIAPVTLTLALLRRFAGWELGHAGAIALSAASVATVVAAIVLWRHAIWRTTVNRRLAAAVVIGTAGMLMVRVVGAIARLDLDVVFTLDMFAVMMVALVVGAGIDRRLLPVALLPAAGTLAGAALPDLVLEIQTIAGLGTCCAVAWVWRRDSGPAAADGESDAASRGL